MMKRRLYFLLPDTGHARTVVDELETSGIDRSHLHIMAAPEVDLEGLPVATRNQRKDLGARLETRLWNGNLALFFIALLLLIVLAVMQVSWYWLLLPGAIMLATFLSGEEFTRKIPNVHLSEFADAIHHREILLMIDVPVNQVARIEDLVLKHHPEAVAGGIGWHSDALHV
jgi:hypothetical protein